MSGAAAPTSIGIMDLLDLLHETMSSPWVYLAIFAIAVLDGFFPVVPSETAVITAGVFAASGAPYLPAVVLVAAAGALVGDHISYAIGRGGGTAAARPAAARRSTPSRHRAGPVGGSRRAAV